MQQLTGFARGLTSHRNVCIFQLLCHYCCHTSLLLLFMYWRLKIWVSQPEQLGSGCEPSDTRLGGSHFELLHTVCILLCDVMNVYRYTQSAVMVCIGFIRHCTGWCVLAHFMVSQSSTLKLTSFPPIIHYLIIRQSDNRPSELLTVVSCHQMNYKY
jgi:hypothetical protein